MNTLFLADDLESVRVLRHAKGNWNFSEFFFLYDSTVFVIPYDS